MQVDVKNLVSMTEANSKIQEDSIAEDQAVEDIAKKILSKHAKAFEEFAKYPK